MTQQKKTGRTSRNGTNAKLDDYIHIQVAERLKADFVAACVRNGATPSEILRLKMRAFVERSKMGGA